MNLETSLQSEGDADLVPVLQGKRTRARQPGDRPRPLPFRPAAGRHFAGRKERRGFGPNTAAREGLQGRFFWKLHRGSARRGGAGKGNGPKKRGARDPGPCQGVKDTPPASMRRPAWFPTP